MIKETRAGDWVHIYILGNRDWVHIYGVEKGRKKYFSNIVTFQKPCRKNAI